MEMLKKNGFLKLIGNAAVVVSLVFVCRKLIGLNIDRGILFSPRVVFHVVWISFLYGLILVAGCVPWTVFLRLFSGRCVPFAEAAWVLNKSNLMKYLPGNVFQFIGRNGLAIRLNLSHADVAFSTVCDVGLLVVTYLAGAALINLRGVERWFTRYGFSGFYFLGIALASAITVLLLLWWKSKDLLLKLTAKLRFFFTWQSAKTLLACFVYVFFLAVVLSALFLAILGEILQVGAAYRAIPAVLSAYMFSWAAGFIVPGAPGGIGIREAALTLLLADAVPLESALLAAVIFRFISTVGDFWGLFAAWVLIKLHTRRCAIKTDNSQGSIV